jgi:hypothetical protein
MKSRAVGLFCDLAYYPSLVAVVNSILHFGVQARIKIYDFFGLPHLVRTYLARHAEVMRPPAGIFGERYGEHWNYRSRFLAAAGIDPCELLLDADTVVLCDLEEAFREIERGQLVAAREWEYPDPVWQRGYSYREPPPDSVFHRRLAHPEIWRQGLPIYNGGLLGLNRERHQVALDLWREATYHHDALDGTFFVVDQNSLALVLASLVREGRVAVHELPVDLWMPTWERHREPPKLLAFEDGSPVLYSGDRTRRMRFYHYTGDIVAPPALAGERIVTVRFSWLVSDVGLPAGLTQEAMRQAWDQVWRGRHASPAGELPGFFYALGPLRAPRCLDPAWRERLARLLSQPELAPPGCAPPERDAREVWALAFAYDYLDYCGYRAGDLGWLEKPLAALLGADLRRRGGERSVAWASDADVVIGFRQRHAERREWTGGEHAAAASPTGCAEHHKGVFLDIARDSGHDWAGSGA